MVEFRDVHRVRVERGVMYLDLSMTLDELKEVHVNVRMGWSMVTRMYDAMIGTEYEGSKGVLVRPTGHVDNDERDMAQIQVYLVDDGDGVDNRYWVHRSMLSLDVVDDNKLVNVGGF